jgi:hypothetical protein
MDSRDVLMSVKTIPGASGNDTAWMSMINGFIRCHEHSPNHSSSKWIFLVNEFNAALLAAYPPATPSEWRTIVRLPAGELMGTNLGVPDLLALALRRG